MTQLERGTLASKEPIESRGLGHEVISGDAHWFRPGRGEGVPIATDGASDRNLESGRFLSSSGSLGDWVGGGETGVELSFPGPAALAQPSSYHSRDPFPHSK